MPRSARKLSDSRIDESMVIPLDYINRRAISMRDLKILKCEQRSSAITTIRVLRVAIQHQSVAKVIGGPVIQDAIPHAPPIRMKQARITRISIRLDPAKFVRAKLHCYVLDNRMR